VKARSGKEGTFFKLAGEPVAAEEAAGAGGDGFLYLLVPGFDTPTLSRRLPRWVVGIEVLEDEYTSSGAPEEGEVFRGGAGGSIHFDEGEEATLRKDEYDTLAFQYGVVGEKRGGAKRRGEGKGDGVVNEEE